MVNIIAYGAMLNKESLAKTIKSREFKEVLVKGYSRIFNQRAAKLHLYNADPKQNRVAIANVIPNEDRYFNAVMFEVDDYEFEKLKIREKSCHTKKITAELKNGERAEAIMFIGNKIYEGNEMQSNDYLPIELYLKRCRNGAYAVSEEFGNKWDETTYLGDGRTVKKYLEDNN